MHYSSHPPRAFCNRIARNLGVLVAAALVAALGLPSAAQAQKPAAPTVTGTGDGTSGTPGAIHAMWGNELPDEGQTGWMVEYTPPGIPWAEAVSLTVGGSGPLMVSAANDPLIHHGVWKVRVSYWKGNAIIGMPSELGDYLHGPPVSAPTGFTAHNAGPDARRLVWDAVTGTSYDTRYTADATDGDEWTDWKMSTSGMLVEDLEPGTEYTFEVRALGMSRAGVGDLHGPSASHTEMIPVPTPTQVTGVTVDEGDAQLVVNWTAVDNATGYTVQWKSGGQGYNTGDRQATVTSGTTTSHTITGLTNGTEYTVQVSATRTGANDGPPSAEVQGTPAVPTAAGVTVSTTALTVTEADTTGGSYTVVLDSEPTATVTVTVAGHAGTDVTRTPGTLTFTTSNWDTVQTVTVTAGDDADTTDDSVTLTHSAASTDTGYSGITIAGVVVTVRDNDTAQVTGVTVDAGDDAQLVVNWTAVDNATGYTVQWKSGGQGYNTGDRQATVTPGSTTSHTIEGLANGTEYTVRVIATRTDANDGPPSAEVTGTTEMIPVPTPTLPEIALLLLAMLLLGSGVYLLRGRQSGGLTHA